jgi:hypothetical protein
LACFNLVKLAEEITEEMQLLWGTAHTFYTQGRSKLINLDQNLIKTAL